ncbi:hypothetical protein BBJ29_009196 [Phytophthora kernoviae]|uniref:RanBD1 domain-containing protein n=1 Tax=Phytophthora kernoviae TaxID=325452 RepID=A0A3F2RL09_9STRA|nr:hypothetical protein BBJ29_009196 [Phytophthora kernoviae]RLN58491.1 hypothetical protein BBP00_00006963 [Phytophthora kernoviae]
MATKGEHEKPDDEHQPIVKKVRLDVDAKVTEDVKKVKIDEDAAPQPEIGSTNNKADEKKVKEDTTVEAKEQEEKVSKPNTTGSAFGGFSAFSGKNAFEAFTAPSDSNGFGTKATSDSTLGGFGATASSGFGATASSGFGDATSSSSSASPDATTTSNSSGFASFQSKSSVTFASFAASQLATDGFGSSTSPTDFSELDVAKKTEPVVPALTEAELANGEEGEQILVERRAKLFKLVEKDYAEVGIGPLRVLNAKDAKSEDGKSTARVVMRRESYARGPGTKLLINASLSSCLVCEKKTEKSMLLTVLEACEDPDAEKKFTPVTYLMRFGSPDDLDIVSARIQSHIHPSTAASS